MNKTTLEQCINWVKCKMANTYDKKYFSVYDWNMLAAILQHLEKLEKQNKELEDKANHYKNKFYKTHKSDERIKDTIREFFNILTLKGLLQDADEDDKPVREIFNNITQKLERLEGLEKENRVIKNSILGTTQYEWINENHKLQKENEKLKERLETLENKNAALKIKVRAWEIQGEKLKKAIEIIKDRLEFILTHYYQENCYVVDTKYKNAYITQQEYELIKEVLNYGKKEN